MDAPETVFSENREKNSSFWITLKDGQAFKGKPYQVQPTDAFFVVWLDSGRFACHDFAQLDSYQRLPETRKFKSMAQRLQESESPTP
jgi:hypothetical protein